LEVNDDIQSPQPSSSSAHVIQEQEQEQQVEDDQQQQQDDNSDYEYMEGSRIMLIVDADETTNKAFQEVVNVFDPDKDELYLLTVTSSLDYLNDEKNSAKLALFKYQSYLDTRKIEYQPISVESLYILTEILKQIEDNEIDIVYIGSRALSTVANTDNIIFSLFSYMKQSVLGTIVEGLERSSFDQEWKLNIIS
ncbi:hypothetical protein SAMD00019534_061680, partial [Acytostelium subglobosum LB1]|uniref:hypothetical protein n=1 Tax=Acytostelium subglobosum LB1 TaxID=1410327 RepID=UPI0006449BC3